MIDQARRRVIEGENVPASEKLVSIFETHTDIIIKDRRDTHFGHKICLTGGRSNLIQGCVVLKGNPADSELTQSMLTRHKDIYGRPPLKAALDGGFASKDKTWLWPRESASRMSALPKGAESAWRTCATASTFTGASGTSGRE